MVEDVVENIGTGFANISALGASLKMLFDVLGSAALLVVNLGDTFPLPNIFVV